MQTGLIWKANLHYYPPAGSVGQTLHDAYRDAFVIQIEGSTAWRLQPKIDQEEVRSGEEETHTLQPGDTLYVPQGWTAVSVEGGDPGRPSLLLSVVSAAEHLNHGRFIDYMLKMWELRATHNVYWSIRGCVLSRMREEIINAYCG